MIQDELELRHAFEATAKMNRLRDKCANESLWHPELRQEVVAGIDGRRRKIEHDIAAYLSERREAA